MSGDDPSAIDVRFLRLRPGARLPIRQTVGASGFDLHACLDAPLVIEGMPRPDAPAWAAVLYTAVMATVVVLLVQSWAQRSVSANRAAVIFALEPVFAALFAVAFGGESLGTRQLAGGALIVLGMLVAVGGEEPP